MIFRQLSTWKPSLEAAGIHDHVFEDDIADVLEEKHRAGLARHAFEAWQRCWCNAGRHRHRRIGLRNFSRRQSYRAGDGDLAVTGPNRSSRTVCRVPFCQNSTRNSYSRSFAELEERAPPGIFQTDIDWPHSSFPVRITGTPPAEPDFRRIFFFCGGAIDIDGAIFISRAEVQAAGADNQRVGAWAGIVNDIAAFRYRKNALGCRRGGGDWHFQAAGERQFEVALAAASVS